MNEISKREKLLKELDSLDEELQQRNIECENYIEELNQQKRKFNQELENLYARNRFAEQKLDENATVSAQFTQWLEVARSDIERITNKKREESVGYLENCKVEYRKQVTKLNLQLEENTK